MEKQNLDILPGGILPVIHCSQGDIGRQFQINLYSDNAPYVLDGSEELTLDGHKEDGNIFTYSLDPVTGSTITISTEEQMTACAGNTICEIRIFKGTTRIGTCNFILQVEEGVSNGTPSESTLQALDEIRAEVQEAVEDAQTAAEDASDYANTAKSWAVGPNGSGTGSDTNNSKYYSEQSANSATNSANSASAAHTSEVNAATSESNASNSASSAATSASNASTSETNAANSASSASQSANNASTSATNAANSATEASGLADDALQYSNNAETSANNAATSAIRAENAKQKIENMTASASQLPEGSAPTVTKSEVGGVVNLAFGIPKGDTGATGATGPKGEDGLGVPAGGTTGQILAKVSNADNDTQWINAPSGTQYPIVEATTTGNLYPIGLVRGYLNGNTLTIYDVIWDSRTSGAFSNNITISTTGQYVFIFGYGEPNYSDNCLRNIGPYPINNVTFKQQHLSGDWDTYYVGITTQPMQITSVDWPFDLGAKYVTARLLPNNYVDLSTITFVSDYLTIKVNSNTIDFNNASNGNILFYYDNYVDNTLIENDTLNVSLYTTFNFSSDDIITIPMNSTISLSGKSTFLNSSSSTQLINTWTDFNPS